MSEHSDETKLSILEAKVEHMMGHVKELTMRVRANEKVVAAIGLLGSIALAFIGAGYFAPKAEAAPSAGEWIQRMREWESEQNRTPIDDSINNALLELEIDYGSDDTTEQEELLQFPSDGDYESIGWRYDRCSDRLGVRSVQEGEGKDSGC